LDQSRTRHGPRPPAPAEAGETSRSGEFSVGLRLFVRNRFLVTLLTVTMICQCGTGAISALNVFFATRDLHASSRLFGIAETAMGVGFIVGALAAGRMVRWIGARALTWSGLLTTGVLAAGYALQRSFPAGLVMLAIYAIPIAMLNTAVAPLLLNAAPRVPGPGDGGVHTGQPARVHALDGRLRLADEHRPAKLPRLVRRRHAQLGQPDIHRGRRADLRFRHPARSQPCRRPTSHDGHRRSRVPARGA
jgi:MFS transporter